MMILFKRLKAVPFDVGGLPNDNDLSTEYGGRQVNDRVRQRAVADFRLPISVITGKSTSR